MEGCMSGVKVVNGYVVLWDGNYVNISNNVGTAQFNGVLHANLCIMDVEPLNGNFLFKGKYLNGAGSSARICAVLLSSSDFSTSVVMTR